MANTTTDIGVPLITGRPTKRTPATEKKIADALRKGATKKDAAAIAGIHYDTFNEWMKEFPEFSVLVERSEAEIANAAAERITNEIRSPTGDWRASEAYLKRRRREDWGDRQEVKHSGRIDSDSDNTGIWDLSRLTNEELDTLEVLITKVTLKPGEALPVEKSGANEKSGSME